MTIIYYTTQYPADTLWKISKAFKEKLGDDVLFLPKDFDVITDCSVEQLESAKSLLEAAIEQKKITNE